MSLPESTWIRPARYATEEDHPDACVYCGEPADTIDHMIPKSMAIQLQSVFGHFSNWPTEYRRNCKKVPACMECNRLLSNNVVLGVLKRREYVHNALRQKYKKYLVRVAWDDDELDELGPYLRQYVDNENAKAQRLRNRLRWPKI